MKVHTAIKIELRPNIAARQCATLQLVEKIASVQRRQVIEAYINS